MPRTNEIVTKTGKKKLTWKPDIADTRDLIYEQELNGKNRVSFLKLLSLPRNVQLKGFSPVEDQGEIGSCTGNAFAGALEFLEKKESQVFRDISRLFIYYNERAYIGEQAIDSGANIRDGIKSLVSYGAAGELIWPYDTDRFAVQPSNEAYADAASHKITKYMRITTHNGILTCLANGYPVIFGMGWYDSYDNEDTGVLPELKGNETLEGGHCMVLTGYDLITRRYSFRNSWGLAWGKQGYGTIPFSSFSEMDDLWTVRK